MPCNKDLRVLIHCFTFTLHLHACVWLASSRTKSEWWRARAYVLVSCFIFVQSCVTVSWKCRADYAWYSQPCMHRQWVMVIVRIQTLGSGYYTGTLDKGSVTWTPTRATTHIWLAIGWPITRVMIIHGRLVYNYIWVRSPGYPDTD